MPNAEYHELIAFLGQRFEVLDRRFEAMDRRFEAMDRRFGTIEERLDEMDRRADERFREILGHFDEIYRRLERLEQEYFAIAQALRRIEAMLADERTRREVLERSVEHLKLEVAALQARLEDLEQHLRG